MAEKCVCVCVRVGGAPESSHSNFPTSQPASIWQLWDVGYNNEEQQQPTMSAFSFQCSDKPLGSGRRQELWGKDGVVQAGLLWFNKCHCGALCQLHKQAAISVPCMSFNGVLFFSPILDLCREDHLSKLCIPIVTFTHGSCQICYCLPLRNSTQGVKPSFSFLIYFLHPYFQKNLRVKLGTFQSQFNFSWGLFLPFQRFLMTIYRKSIATISEIEVIQRPLGWEWIGGVYTADGYSKADILNTKGSFQRVSDRQEYFIDYHRKPCVLYMYACNQKWPFNRPALLYYWNASYKGVSITFWQKILALTINRGEDKGKEKKLWNLTGWVPSLLFFFLSEPCPHTLSGCLP